MQSGWLTQKEAARLEAEQDGMRDKETAMKSDGMLPKQERKELHRDLERSSRHIAKGTHDRQKDR